MVQGFFVKVLEKRIFDAADSSRGKLRSFLLTGLQRHVKDESNKASALRRGGGKVVSFDSVQAEEWYTGETLQGESAEHLFDRQWALTLLGNAVKRLESQAADSGKTAQFLAMKHFLTDEGSAEAYERSAADLSMKPDSFKVAVHRLRAKFRIALRAEVAETQHDQACVDEEITYLTKVLSGM
jgi:RNA polymerase sigma-70 factor (ECF subfamily)